MGGHSDGGLVSHLSLPYHKLADIFVCLMIDLYSYYKYRFLGLPVNPDTHGVPSRLGPYSHSI